MNTSKFHFDKTIVGVFLFGWLLYLGYIHNPKTAQAVTNASGLSSQYGCMVNRNVAGYDNYYTDSNSSSYLPMQAVLYIDFSNNTMKGLMSAINGYNNTNNIKTIYQSFNSSFTESTISGVTNVYKYTHTLTFQDNSTSTVTMIGVVVNSGNTVLLTQFPNDQTNGQTSANWSGVCQKV